MKKNILITGHRDGIGLSFYNQLTNLGHNVEGYDLEDGYDLSLKPAQNLVLSSLLKFDIFINSLYKPDIQTYFLKEATAKWKGKDKIIINMNSYAVIKNNPDDPEAAKVSDTYLSDKREQDEFSMMHNSTGDKLKILNIYPSWVDTKVHENADHLVKINPDTLVSFVLANIDFDKMNCPNSISIGIE